MKKFILTFGIILTALFTVNAQNGTIDTKTQTDKILSEYTSIGNLTPDQVAKVRPILENFYTTRKENKEKYANDSEGMKAANKANRENFAEQLKTVLSPEQIQKMKEYDRKKRAERKDSKETNQE
ncbi:MAG TPA: hypothetical protein VN922_18760 [Bacteroidia bacterium]|nr:hypothetical protein [Bacteroidia bacterium]